MPEQLLTVVIESVTVNYCANTKNRQQIYKLLPFLANSGSCTSLVREIKLINMRVNWSRIAFNFTYTRVTIPEGSTYYGFVAETNALLFFTFIYTFTTYNTNNNAPHSGIDSICGKGSVL